MKFNALNAQNGPKDITIGTKMSNSSQHIPLRLMTGETAYNGSSTANYNYSSISQQIYTYEEIIVANEGTVPEGKISKLTFYSSATSIESNKTVTIYMKNTNNSSFTAWDTDFTGTGGDVNTYRVYSGAANINDEGEMIFELNPAFDYDGKSNIIIFFDSKRGEDGTGKGTDYKFYYNTTSNKQCAYQNSGSLNFGLVNGNFNWPNFGNSTGKSYHNMVTFTFSADAGGDNDEPSVEVTPESIAFGDVAVGDYWSEKGSQSVKITASNTTITNISCNNDFFVLPNEINYTSPINLTIGYNKEAEDGEKTGKLTITYDNKTKEVDITANAYVPATPDVWELPYEVVFNNEGGFSNTPIFANLHDNYILPTENNDGNLKDAVYKIVIDNVCRLSLSMDGNDAFMALYKSTSIGDGPSNNSFKYGNTINTFQCDPGTYYLVAAASSQFTVNISKETLPLPGDITYTSPAENNVEYNNYLLTWKLGSYTEQYQLLFGTDKGNLNTIVDWTSTLKNYYDFPWDFEYESCTRYYWQVNAKNATGTTYGPIYSFYTKLSVPQNVTASSTQIYPNNNVNITWEDEDGKAKGYNVYIKYNGNDPAIKYNDELITDKDKPYTINLDYTSSGHVIYVTAVYDLSYDENDVDFKSKESDFSNPPVYIKVTDYVNVSGIITDSEENPLADATVSFVGKDDFGIDQSYEFSTNENGEFSSSEVLAGTYTVTISKDEYVSQTLDVMVTYNQQASVIEVSLKSAPAIFNEGWSTNNLANKDVIIKAGNAPISGELTVKSIVIEENASLTLSENAILTVTGKFTNTIAENLIINDGAQIFQNNDNVAATFNMDIVNPTGEWNDSENTTGWQFISSPFTNAKFEDFIPSTSDYDLYKYDGTQKYEWLNKKPYTVTVEGESTHAAVPSHINYEYSLSQQIYLAEDLESKTGSITGFSFKTASETSNGITRKFTVYMINTDKTSFETVKDWVSVKGLTPVFNGEVTYNTKDEWTTIKFDTPFEYTGENIVLCINDNSGNYNYNSASYYTMNTNENRTLCKYSSSYINAYTMAYEGNLANYVNNAQFIFDLSGDNTYNFQQGVGYLASYEKETTATLSGILNNATTHNYNELSYTNGEDLANFHLLGNPFTFDMKLENFIWNNNVVEGVAIVNSNGGYKYSTVAEDEIATIPVGDGFFIKATGDSPSIIYNEVGGAKRGEIAKSINVIATSKAGNDNVVICFSGEKDGFDKLQNFNREIANIYVENNGNRYGIYNCDENTTEVELSFSASQMGTYSISLDINGDFENVVLVDRLTGIETNMLIEDEYTFVATSKDNAKRFFIRLEDNSQEPTTNSMFVYQSGEELIVNAEGSIEIIDMMGRVVYSSNADNNRINVSGLNKSAYIVRNINENTVRTQKIVIL